MATNTSVRLYFLGKTPEEALKGLSEPVFEEKVAQELAHADESVYAIDVTIFSSRLKPIKKWDEDD